MKTQALGSYFLPSYYEQVDNFYRKIKISQNHVTTNRHYYNCIMSKVIRCLSQLIKSHQQPLLNYNEKFLDCYSWTCIKGSHITKMFFSDSTGDRSISDIPTDLLSLEKDISKPKRKKYIPRQKSQLNLASNYTLLDGSAVFGLYPVAMALECKKRAMNYLYIKKTLLTSNKDIIVHIQRLCREQDIKVICCPKHKLDQLADGRPHQGIVLDASELKFSNVASLTDEDFTATNLRNNRLWLVLNTMKDPMNFGAVLRSSYYLGVERVFVARPNSCGLTGTVSKASSGAMERIPVYGVKFLHEFVHTCKNYGWKIFGTTVISEDGNEIDDETDSLHNGNLIDDQTNSDTNVDLNEQNSDSIPAIQPKSVNVTEAKASKRMVLIIGNEHEGLATDTLSLCDQLLHIESLDVIDKYVDSLNVSVATGITLHHLLGKRRH